jgi:hypothetical protein
MANYLWKSQRNYSGIWRGSVWNVSPTGTRLSLDGPTILDPDGNPIHLRGTNQGTWGENYSIDAPAIASYGATVVRILIRWEGDYEAGIDCSSENPADDYIDPAHFLQFMEEIDWLIAQGIWVIVAFDSDFGAANRGLGGADWNFFDSTPEGLQYRARFKQGWRKIERAIRGKNYIAALELLPEPMPTGDSSAYVDELIDFYEEIADDLINQGCTTPFLVGPRDSYNALYIDEILMPGRSDMIYTIDHLNNKTENEDTMVTWMEGLAAFRDTNNVPVLINQLGRNSSDDEGNATTTENLGLTALCGALSCANAHGIHYTHWQYHQNTGNAGAYALWYKTVYPGDGPYNWTPKTNEIAAFTFHMNQTGASLEAAAIAAATAANAELWYVKSDFSNVWQTNDTSTPVTAVGQTIGRLAPVVGTRVWSQSSATLRPLLAEGVNDYHMVFDGTDDTMQLDATYFADGDDTFVICAGRAAPAAANRVMFHTGNSSANVRYPYLAVNATDVVTAAWRGDDTTLRNTDTTTLCDDRAIVATAWKSGATKKNFLQGVQEGTTNSDAVGSIASITRTRLGASTTGSNPFNGPIALVCISKTMTDEQRRAIARWGAWLVGAPFRGAIPQETETWGSEELLSVNMGPNYDFSTRVFINVLHSGRAWCPDSNGGGYGYENVTLKTVGEKGYPATGETATMVFLSDLTDYDAGDYLFECSGDLSSKITNMGTGSWFSGPTYSAITNKTTGTWRIATGQDGTGILALKFTNVPADFGALKFNAPGYALATTDVFRSDALTHFAPFKTLRFMDWLETNGSETDWAEAGNQDTDWATARASKWDDAFWYKHSLKACFDFFFANDSNIIWTNIPAKATDAYISSYVAEGAVRLAADKTWWIEFGNELWNNTLGQSTAYMDMRTGGFTAAKVKAGDDFTSISRTSNVVTAVFDTAHNLTNGASVYVKHKDDIFTAGTEVITVVNATTITWADVGADNASISHADDDTYIIGDTSHMLAANLSDYNQPEPNTTANYIRIRYALTRAREIWEAVDALGETARIKVLLGTQGDNTFNYVPCLVWAKEQYGDLNWLYAMPPATYAEPANPAGIASEDDVFTQLDTDMTDIMEKMLRWNNLMTTLGMHSVSYECGPHTHWNGGNAAATPFILAAHLDSRMGDRVIDWHQSWVNRGGQQFCWFHGGITEAAADPNSTWPVTYGDFTDDATSEKYQAFVTLENTSVLPVEESGVNFGTIRYIDVLPDSGALLAQVSNWLVIDPAEATFDITINVAVETAGNYTLAIDAARHTDAAVAYEAFVDGASVSAGNLPSVNVFTTAPSEAFSTTVSLSAGIHTVKFHVDNASRADWVGLYRVRLT